MTKAKKKGIIIILVIISALAYHISTVREEQAVLAKQKEIEQTAKDYNDGLWYIEKENFEDAKKSLYRFYDGKYNGEEEYKDAQILAMYATARYDEWAPNTPYRLQYSMANDELKKIPNDYSGQYCKDIQNFKKKIRDRLDTYAQTDKDEVKERASKIYVGDSDVKVTQIFGEPQRKNKTTTGNTVREQWVYGNGNYVYIENGVVTGWQDSK